MNHFNAKVTLYAKGIACCTLLWHHLFYLHPEYGFFIHETAKLAKVCVAVFVMLSGYGLSASSSKLTPMNFYRIRLSKLYIGGTGMVQTGAWGSPS
jgi:membrane-bound acyltransferase YfiQ involved in biofilm formation